MKTLLKELSKARLQLLFPELQHSEVNVIYFYACGISYKVISKECGITVKTVDNILSRVREALDLTTTSEIRTVVLLRTLLNYNCSIVRGVSNDK